MWTRNAFAIWTSAVCFVAFGSACEETGERESVDVAQLDVAVADSVADSAADTSADTVAVDSSMSDVLTPDAGDVEPTDTRWPDVDSAKCGEYAVDGPHGVGVTTITVDGTPVEVWYPAKQGATEGKEKDSYDMRNWLPKDERDKISDEKAPRWTTDAYRDVEASGDGPFPFVLFSHGFGGYRLQSTFLTVHLASWGFVVASADHDGRLLASVLEGNLSMQDDAPEKMRSVWKELESRAKASTGRFVDLIDVSKVAVTGHSAGAASASTYAEKWSVAGLVGMAGGPRDASQPVDVSGTAMLMSGTKDDVVTANQVKSAWDALKAPKRYLAVRDAGHLAFADICLIGRDRGGVLEIADRNGINVPGFLKTLATDGCSDDELPPEIAWPMINHYATAHIRVAMGIDSSPVDLGESTARCFDGLVESYETDGL